MCFFSCAGPAGQQHPRLHTVDCALRRRNSPCAEDTSNDIAKATTCCSKQECLCMNFCSIVSRHEQVPWLFHSKPHMEMNRQAVPRGESALQTLSRATTAALAPDFSQNSIPPPNKRPNHTIKWRVNIIVGIGCPRNPIGLSDNRSVQTGSEHKRRSSNGIYGFP